MYLRLGVLFVFVCSVCGCVSPPKWTPLHAAVRAGDHATVEALLADGKGVDIDRTGYAPDEPKGDLSITNLAKTPLCIAIQRDDRKSFEMLLASGADPGKALLTSVVSERKEYLDQCLSILVNMPHFGWGKTLSEYRGRVPELDLMCLINHALVFSIVSGKAEMLNTFFEHGMDANKPMFGRGIIVPFLKYHGNEVNYLDIFPEDKVLNIIDNRMISLAVLSNQKDVISILLEHNATLQTYEEVEIRYNFIGGYRYIRIPSVGPLEWALILKNTEMVEFLLAQGANPRWSNASVENIRKSISSM